MCPAYLNSAGHAHAWFGVKASSNDARSDVGCGWTPGWTV